MTAAEVRKRLTQYYDQPEHQAELVIGYQPGSYVPECFQPGRLLPGRLRCRADRGDAACAAAQAGAAAVGSGGHCRCGPGEWRNSTSDHEEPVPASVARDAGAGFWEPLLASPAPVLICTPAAGQDVADVVIARSQREASGMLSS
jgi:hypothetical protein